MTWRSSSSAFERGTRRDCGRDRVEGVGEAPHVVAAMYRGGSRGAVCTDSRGPWWWRFVTTFCLKCGSDVEQNGVCRRKVYCGRSCRRAAEYELRRLQRALEAAERAVYK